MGTDVIYTDDGGNYLIEGSLFDTKSRTDITRARIDKLTAIDFASLPLKDAMVQKQGTGARKLVVFADPNCGYCKRLEKDLLQVKDVTIYTFSRPCRSCLGPRLANSVQSMARYAGSVRKVSNASAVVIVSISAAARS